MLLVRAAYFYFIIFLFRFVSFRSHVKYFQINDVVLMFSCGTGLVASYIIVLLRKPCNQLPLFANASQICQSYLNIQKKEIYFNLRKEPKKIYCNESPLELDFTKGNRICELLAHSWNEKKTYSGMFFLEMWKEYR